MTWQEARERFPAQWLLVEATAAHSKEGRRILDDVAVLDAFPTGKSAMGAYLETHDKAKSRELYVLNTEADDLEIEELRWLGIRSAA
jgi:hypothetical protein